ncbi:hypothetical protein [Devosia ginsengisoli]|uniref:DUF3035 domain-containing protein n=1 Tax=Devosia ginsengisoli TaxID=400770 RepID=A0A5B8LN07_9HYPH|nr:hypothetical protein [Devosia ginsengisoli]QDZ09359.1 hypothetical protein FPZ08_00485 [Devosia ginsengisoli]
MRIGLTGQHTALRAATRTGLASLALMAALALGACTTVEGTNALTDFGTFEREVMTTTARGVGLIPGETPKEDITNARAPLVLPAAGQALPAPAPEAAVAQLPTNSDSVQIDTTNLTQADIQRLRNAKVVDLNSVAGRPLTEQETRSLMARMQAHNADVTTVNGKRPLYMPPEEYFIRVGNADLVCATPSGEVVSLNDPKCPESVRKAIRATYQGPGGGFTTNSGPGVGLTDKETQLD